MYRIPKAFKETLLILPNLKYNSSEAHEIEHHIQNPFSNNNI